MPLVVPMPEAAAACKAKMEAANINSACIRTFLAQHSIIAAGLTGEISETFLKPVQSLDTLESLKGQINSKLLEKTVIVKLNGGLGTGMGLHKAKSLLAVKDGRTFLDFTALQVKYLRDAQRVNLRFMLMNSNSTSADTKAYLSKYPFLHAAFDQEVELMQNWVPKIRQDDFFPVTYDADKSCEWAPPGHGDLFIALYGSGRLEELLAAGYAYMFVSNGDNLGATLDAALLTHMEEKKLDFLMEVCQRTDSDRKGGHLAFQRIAVENNSCGGNNEKEEYRLALRESAQCPKEDEASFQDITKHRFFNTNNLWINLVSLKKEMDRQNGTLQLPVIRNAKTVNPVDSHSTKVFQLETAMGAAIASFSKSAAVVVPRTRFAPVKTCADLLTLRSDAYTVTEDNRLELCKERKGEPPLVDLDSAHYKVITGLEKLIPHGVPSLRECKKLNIEGLVQFGPGVVIKGEVKIKNSKAEPLVVEGGRVLQNETVEV